MIIPLFNNLTIRPPRRVTARQIKMAGVEWDGHGWGPTVCFFIFYFFLKWRLETHHVSSLHTSNDAPLATHNGQGTRRGRLYPRGWHTSINWCLYCSRKAAFILPSFVIFDILLNHPFPHFYLLKFTWRPTFSEKSSRKRYKKNQKVLKRLLKVSDWAWTTRFYLYKCKKGSVYYYFILLFPLLLSAESSKK